MTPTGDDQCTDVYKCTCTSQGERGGRKVDAVLTIDADCARNVDASRALLLTHSSFEIDHIAPIAPF